MEGEQEKHEDPERPIAKEVNYLILKTQRSLKHNFIVTVAQIYDSLLWQTIFVSSVFVHTIALTFIKVFKRSHNDDVLYLPNAIYFVNYILTCVIYFKKDIHIYMEESPENKVVFFIETCFLIPFGQLYDTFAKDWSFEISFWLAVPTMLRIFHVFHFFYKKTVRAGINHWIYFVIDYAIILFNIQHAIACIWYVEAFPVSIRHDYPLTWVNRTLFDLDLIQHPSDWYLLCYYYAMSYTTNSSFGDVYATNVVETLISILAMCTGFIITTGIFIGSLQSRLINGEFRRRETRRLQMSDINKFLKLHMINKETKTLITSYYDVLWKKKNGIYEAKEALLMLPAPLRNEICYDINVLSLHCSTIFRDKPEAFLRAVANIMKHEFYQPGEMIYYRNVIKSKMVFVVLGTVEILSDEDDESPIIAFDSGTCLGESCLVFSQPSKSCVRTACYTELQVLRRKHFAKIIDLFPGIYADIQKEIMQRVTESQSIKQNLAPSTAVKIHLFSCDEQESSLIHKLKEKLRGTLSKDEDDKYLSMYKLHDRMPKIAKDMRITFTRKTFVIHPNSLVSAFWEALIIILVFVIGITYPYYVAFEGHFPIYLDVLSYLFDFIYILDLVLTLFTAIETKNVRIISFNGVVQEQVKRFEFYLDIFSVLAFENFCNPENTAFYYTFKLNRLLKSYRVCKLFHRIENNLSIPIFLTRLTKYLTYVLACSYWIGNISYMTTCYELICDETGWFFNKLKTEVKLHLEESLAVHEVFISIYFALTVFCRISVGDLLPGDKRDLVVIMLNLITGTLIFAFCTAELAATITHRLREKRNFQEYLFSVRKFLKEKYLNEALNSRIMKFFEMQWYYDKGLSLQEKSLFYNASEKIKTDVRMKEKVEFLLKVPIFQNTSYDFLRVLSTGIESLALPPNEVLYKAGTRTKTIFIIQEGYCLRKLSKHEFLMGPYGSYGALSSLTQTDSLATITSLTHVKVFRLQEKVLWAALSVFPNIKKEFRKTIEIFDMKKELITYRKDVENFTKQDYPFKKWSKHQIQGSWIDVKTYCDLNGESYGEPFANALGYFFFIKYLIPPICLLPDGIFLKFWVTFRFLVTIVLVILVSYQQVAVPYFKYLNTIIFVLDIITYLDIIIMMFVGYYGPKKQLIIHPTKTIPRYLKGRFIFDVLFCFPWEYFAKPLYKLGLIKLLQIYRIPRYFDYLQRDIKKKLYYIEIWKFFTISIITAHYWACLVLATTCYYSSPDNLDFINTSIEQELFTRKKLALDTMYCRKDSWVDKSIYKNFSSPLEVFVLALYFCVSILTTCGFGDISVTYRNNVIIVSVMMVYGILFFGYMYASTSSYRVDWNSIFSNNQRLTKEIKNYMVREHVSSTTQKRVIDNLQYVWGRSGGAEPNEILCSLHLSLHEDVILEMYGRILKNVSLFEDADEGVIALIGRNLKERYYNRNEVILRAQDVVSHIFIIYRGNVELISLNHDKYVYMGPGGIFGSITANVKSQMTMTVTALNHVDCLCIETAKFYSIVETHPQLAKKITNLLTSTVDYVSNLNEEFEDKDLQKTASLRSLEPNRKGGTTALSNAKSRNEFFVLTSPKLFLLFLPWKWFRVVIEPDSKLYTIFDILAVIIALLNYATATYQFFFQSHSLKLLFIAISIDTFFIIKLFYDLHKTYENRYGELQTSNKEIIKRFFQKKNIVNHLQILASIPIPYFLLLLKFTRWKSQTYLAFTISRLITLLRFTFVCAFREESRNKLLVNTLLLEIFTIGISCSILIHTSACIWYFITCPFGKCVEGTWTSRIPGSQHITNQWEIYLRCIYYNVEIITTSGVGDLRPDPVISQLIYIVIVMLLINCIIGIFIGEVVDAIDSYTATLSHYEYEIENLNCFLRNEHLSKYQMNKMMKYVLQLWKASNGRQMPRLLSKLPTTLHGDLMYEIYGKHLKNSYIFEGTEESFLKQLSSFVKHTVFFPSNYIVQQGDSDRCMYFVHSGEVEILTVHPNLMETIHETIYTGDMFGLIQGLYHGVPHHFAFRAKTNVHIVSLCLTDWEDLLIFFPECKQIIYNRAQMQYTII